MKNLTRIFLIILATVLMTACFTVSASAKVDIDELKKSVIYIETTFQYSSRNWGFEGSITASGTGFGIGKPGEPVKYLATAAHVVRDANGTYALLALTDSGTVIDIVKMSDTTPYTNSIEDAEIVNYNGYECYVIVDYVEVTTPVKKAYFSYANNDYRTISIVDINDGADVAICEFSGEPVDKIKAYPLQFKDEIKTGTKIVSIGFPGVSEYLDAEMTLESKDSISATGDIKRLTKMPNNAESDRTINAYEVSGDMSQGMSGGPVFNLETGAIIGINSKMAFNAQVAVNTKYAVCVDYLRPLLDENGISYVEYSPFPAWIIFVLIAAVAVIAIVVIVVIVNTKKGGAKGGFIPNTVPSPVAVPTAPSNKYYLLGVSGALAGKKYSLSNRAVIGRDSAKCNVVFAESQPGVSGVHCEVSVVNGSFVLKDCGSSYGTFLENGEKLQPNVPVTLRNGSRFWLATSENTFEVKH